MAAFWLNKETKFSLKLVVPLFKKFVSKIPPDWYFNYRKWSISFAAAFLSVPLSDTFSGHLNAHLARSKLFSFPLAYRAVSNLYHQRILCFSLLMFYARLRLPNPSPSDAACFHHPVHRFWCSKEQWFDWFQCEWHHSSITPRHGTSVIGRDTTFVLPLIAWLTYAEQPPICSWSAHLQAAYLSN